MKLKKLMEELMTLDALGYGEFPVFYRHSSSGDCGAVNTPRITSYIDNETGPFDLEEGAEYIALSVG